MEDEPAAWSGGVQVLVQRGEADLSPAQGTDRGDQILQGLLGISGNDFLWEQRPVGVGLGQGGDRVVPVGVGGPGGKLCRTSMTGSARLGWLMAGAREGLGRCRG